MQLHVIHISTCTVPVPSVSLNITPHGPLLVGGAEDITLTCSALLDLTVVDTQRDILYSFTWRDRAGVEIVSGDRITISQSSSTTAFSSLTLSPLTTMDTNFTCTVEVSVPANTLLPSDLAMASISLDIGGELMSTLPVYVVYLLSLPESTFLILQFRYEKLPCMNRKFRHEKLPRNPRHKRSPYSLYTCCEVDEHSIGKGCL